MAVLQKFIDQSISTNTTYNPVYFEDEKIPMSTMLTDMLVMYKYGIKTGYYLNTNDNAGEIKVNDDLPSDELEDEDSCDSYKI
jgi:ribonucleoside-diphosphate reductase alpha chain